MVSDRLTDRQIELLQVGQDDGLISLEDDHIVYVIQGKKYRLTDPEEPVRAATYLELVYRYKYDPKVIDFEIYPPRREPKLPADIVVFKGAGKEKAFIVVEAKSGLTGSEISVAKREGLGNCNLLLADWLLLSCGEEKLVYYVKERPSRKELDQCRRSDLPEAYGKVPRYRFKKGGDVFEELRKASLRELRSKFKRCHDAIWEGGKRDPAEAFDEMSKLMFTKIYDEKYTKIDSYYKFQVGSHENSFIVSRRIREELFGKAQDKEPEVFKEDIRVPDDVIFEVVEILQDISLTKTDLDAKGRAFEEFLGKIFRGELGQFFTPREIIEFMVQLMDPGCNEMVIDPACGSGGFLLYCMKHVMEKSQREYGEENSKEKIWSFSHQNVFGIEINDRIARIAMMDMVIHDDGHTNIECNDALAAFEAFDPRRDIRPGKYDVVLTNPPFGASEKRREILGKYELGRTQRGTIRASQTKEKLFIERCIRLLRPGGRLGIVVPDGILNNMRDEYVRECILENAKITAIVSMPVYAFSPFGSGMKTSLVFLEKYEEDNKLEWGDYRVFISKAENIGYDSTGRDVASNDLPQILEDFLDRRTTCPRTMYINPKDFVSSLKVKELRESFDFSRLDPDYYFMTEELDDLLESLSHPLAYLKDLVQAPLLSGARPPGRAKYFEGEVPSIEGGNVSDTGHITLEGLKFVPQSFHNAHKASAVTGGDILVVKDGATTGKVGLIPPDFPYEDCNINEHLFRVRIDEEIIDPLYVFGLLFSDLGQLILNREITGGAQGGMTKSAIRDRVLIPRPPEDVQMEIRMDVEEALEEVKRLNAQSRDTLQALKSGVTKAL